MWISRNPRPNSEYELWDLQPQLDKNLYKDEDYRPRYGLPLSGVDYLTYSPLETWGEIYWPFNFPVSEGDCVEVSIIMTPKMARNIKEASVMGQHSLLLDMQQDCIQNRKQIKKAIDGLLKVRKMFTKGVKVVPLMVEVDRVVTNLEKFYEEQ